MSIVVQGRAVTQAIAKIHWSIAFSSLDSMLEQDAASLRSSELRAAISLVDEALAELREAYMLASAESIAIPTPGRVDGGATLESDPA